MSKTTKPINCTCGYPKELCRNTTGHAPECPAHATELARMAAAHIGSQPRCIAWVRSYDYENAGWKEQEHGRD